MRAKFTHHGKVTGAVSVFVFGGVEVERLGLVVVGVATEGGGVGV